MAEPAGEIPRPRLELSLPEARTRFVQLARLASLTGQTTLVTDAGRPLAAIVPADTVTAPAALQRAGPTPAGRGAPAGPAPAGDGAARPTQSPSVRGVPEATAGPGGSVPTPSTRGAPEAAAGWVRRIETLRAEFQRQHGVLEEALERVWQELDRVRPPGSDGGVDALRVSQADIRRPSRH
ncbi:hypothetical protein AB0J80_37165 [Actinoplanes sp. NPDC049548]|uniref:hypothetical protein n=1 Tax=Actinoplanes sp. NPDC049548 TaxID=3155152 RepID=UPI0034203E9D